MLQRTFRHAQSALPAQALSPGPRGRTPLAGRPLVKGWPGKTVFELRTVFKCRDLTTMGKNEDHATRWIDVSAKPGATQASRATTGITSTNAIKCKKLTTTFKSSAQSQLRHASTMVLASIVTTKPATIPSKSIITSRPLSSTEPISLRKRMLHTSKPVAGMLSDNVQLPSFTAAQAPIEIPYVPILPGTKRPTPTVEIDAHTTEHPIITAAGAHTHPAPPGRGAGDTKEHLQSDSTKRKGRRQTEKQEGRFEGDWTGERREADEHRFVPEEGQIPGNERAMLWGAVGAVTLWALFGPSNRKQRK